MHSEAKFAALAALLLVSSPAGAQDSPPVVFEDDFSEDLGDWEIWSRSGALGGYELTRNVDDGAPAPSARVAGGNIWEGRGNPSDIGMQRRFEASDVGKQFFVEFDWRTTGAASDTTYAGFSVASARDGAELTSRWLHLAGTADTGWLRFPATDLSPYLPEGPPIPVFVRVFLNDRWRDNKRQTIHLDNFRLVAGELPAPPEVPMEVQAFDEGVEGWQPWQESANHSYELTWDPDEGQPPGALRWKGDYPYTGRITYRFGVQRTVPVALPFVLSLDWNHIDGGPYDWWASLQLLDSSGRLIVTESYPPNEGWRTWAPRGLSELVASERTVTLRVFMIGADRRVGPPSTLWIDNVRRTAPCEQLRVYFRDLDGDGFGDRDTRHPLGPLCHGPPGWVADDSDCDDTRPEVHPGAEELCDQLDNDCDPSTSEVSDLDEDGSTGCPAEDCDDLDPRRAPGNPELCDGIDNDCDPATDLDGADVDEDEDGVPVCAGDCDDRNVAVGAAADGECPQDPPEGPEDEPEPTGAPLEEADDDPGPDPDGREAPDAGRAQDRGGCMASRLTGPWPWATRR